MQSIVLYRTLNADGSTTVSPVQRAGYDSTLYRLIADAGKELVCGGVRTPAVDTETPDAWTEADAE